MTTKLEVREDEETGHVLCKIANRGGRWARPLMDDNGNFYRSACVAAEALNVSSPTIRNAVSFGLTLKDRTFRYATLEEAEANQGGGRLLTKQLTFMNELTEATTSTTSNTNNTTTATTTTGTETPFAGVQWPDGTVTIRLSSGGDWSMTRASIALIPEEIRGECAWL